LFKSKYTSPRVINAEEHMKVLNIARQPVDDTKLLLETNVHVIFYKLMYWKCYMSSDLSFVL